MGSMKCDWCDKHGDETEIRIWEPKVICDRCFEKIPQDELWELAEKLNKNLHEEIQRLRQELKQLKSTV